MLINDVYIGIKSVLEKYDRGYVTPSEFNKAARYAQTKIIREAITDLDKYKNRKKKGLSNKDYADKAKEIRAILDKLYKKSALNFDTDHFDYPSDFYFEDMLEYNSREIEEGTVRDARDLSNIGLLGIEETFPIYISHSNYIEVIPDTIIDGVDMWYYREANDPVWAYTGNPPVFDEPNSTDFELPTMLYSEIIREMLIFLGIQLKDYEVVQIFSQQENQTENQNYQIQ